MVTKDEKMSGLTKHKQVNTLECMMYGLIGCRISIELFNESYVTGKLTGVLGGWNVTMEDVVLVDGNNKRFQPLERFFLKGRKIRYVHIPDHIDPMEAMKNVIYGSKQPTRDVVANTNRQQAIKRKDKQIFNRKNEYY